LSYDFENNELQSTDIKLLEIFPAVSGKFIQPQKTDMKKHKGNRGMEFKGLRYE
jgi:hypothetical protein